MVKTMTYLIMKVMVPFKKIKHIIKFCPSIFFKSFIVYGDQTMAHLMMMLI
jgi:hypothetical protein